MQRELHAKVTPQQTMRLRVPSGQDVRYLSGDLLEEAELLPRWKPWGQSADCKITRDRVQRHTFQIKMGGPVPLDMRDHTFSTAVETRVIPYADTSAGGVEVVECAW